MDSSTSDSSSDSSPTELTQEEMIQAYYDLLKRSIADLKDELLSYVHLTPEKIVQNYFADDPSLAEHLARKLRDECSVPNIESRQIALFYPRLDSFCKRALFPKVGYTYDSDRIMSFFHFLVCHFAPHIFQSLWTTYDLPTDLLEPTIEAWKKKDSIDFFFGLNEQIQDVMLRYYAKENADYFNHTNYLQMHLLKMTLGM